MIIINIIPINCFAAQEDNGIYVYGEKVGEVIIAIDIANNKVSINGEDIGYKGDRVYIEDTGEIMIPIKYTDILLNINIGRVVWDEATRTANFCYGTYGIGYNIPYVKFPADKKEVNFWGNIIATEQNPVLKNDTMYVSLKTLQTVYNIKDESIMWDTEKQILMLDRSFNFDSDKISIIETVDGIKNESRGSFYRRIEVDKKELIENIKKGFQQGFTISKENYRGLFTIWIDFNNGTTISMFQKDARGFVNYYVIGNSSAGGCFYKTGKRCFSSIKRRISSNM